MRKQLVIIAATFIAGLVSCTKGNNDLAQINNSEEAVTASDTEKGSGPLSTRGRKLELLLPFNGNISDASGKSVNVVISSNSADVYTEDRFGTPNSAIKFDGTYGLTLTGVGVSNNMSLSAWVKYGSASTPLMRFFSGPLSFGQANDMFSGSVSTPATQGVYSPSVDANWHHLVATYDGSRIRFYVDGSFVGEAYNPGSFPGGPGGVTCWVGGSSSTQFWDGSLDDLRYYTRTLKAHEIQSFYDL